MRFGGFDAFKGDFPSFSDFWHFGWLRWFGGLEWAIGKNGGYLGDTAWDTEMLRDCGACVGVFDSLMIRVLNFSIAGLRE